MTTPHTIIVGNGVAGITAALTLRERDARTKITVIGEETDYFFSRTALMYAYMDKLDRRDMEPFERKHYDRARIDRVRDRVTDLDATARTLTLASGRVLAYDRLLLATGSSPRALNLPGGEAVREGLVHFVSMQDLDACERLTHSTREAVVIGGGLIGIELVECLRHHGVKVTFLVREPWYWPAALDEREARMVTGQLVQHGVTVRFGEQAVSVATDGQGRVASVTTDAGAVLPCQMLGVAIGVEPNVQWLARVRTPPALARGLVVDDRFATSLRNVWGAGDCAEIHPDGVGNGPGVAPFIEPLWYAAKRHGELVAKNMSGAHLAYRPPVFFNSAKFMGLEYTTVGDVDARSESLHGARQLFRRHRTRAVTQRIVHREGRVVGFNMLGSRWNHEVLMAWIDEHRDLAWVRENLHRAQFDVEFGRVDLSAMIEEGDVS